MYDAPLFMEYACRERIKDLSRLAESSRPRPRTAPTHRPARPGGLRRRLARRLVSLGLYLDPQAGGPASSNGRPRLAHR
jgi:hypothetical protein